MTLPANFWAKTRTTDCLIWTGAVNTKGYPCIAIGQVSTLAHRVAYEDVHGPIPDGMTIDHKCRVRNCVKVEHLEVVSIAENNRRRRVAGGIRIGSVCRNGHEVTAESIYFHPRGHTECGACRADNKRRAREKRAA